MTRRGLVLLVNAGGCRVACGTVLVVLVMVVAVTSCCCCCPLFFLQCVLLLYLPSSQERSYRSLEPVKRRSKATRATTKGDDNDRFLFPSKRIFSLLYPFGPLRERFRFILYLASYWSFGMTLMTVSLARSKWSQEKNIQLLIREGWKIPSIPFFLPSKG